MERMLLKHLSGSKANQVEEFDFNKPELTIAGPQEAISSLTPSRKPSSAGNMAKL